MSNKPNSKGRIVPLLVCCAVLGLVVLLVLPIFAWVGHSRSGPTGIWAAVFAALICLGAGCGALACVAFMRGPQLAIQGVLVAMIFRMGIPLGAAVLLTARGGWLADAGIFGQIVGFYLVVLVVETLLSLRFVERGNSNAANSTAPVSL